MFINLNERKTRIIELIQPPLTRKKSKIEIPWKFFLEECTCLRSKITEDVKRNIVEIQRKPCQDPTSPRKPMAACKHGNPSVLVPDIDTSKLTMENQTLMFGGLRNRLRMPTANKCA